MFRSPSNFRRRNRTRNSGSQLIFAALEPKNLLAANFLDFSVIDASQDQTSDTVFEYGALALDFSVEVTSGILQAVEIFAQNGSDVLKIGEYFEPHAAEALISLDGFSDLSGTQEIFGIVSTSDGQYSTSSSVDIDVLPTVTVEGNFRATDFDYQGAADSAYVLRAFGGTDTLALNFDSSVVTGFNGESIGSYDRDAFVTSQAFYQGSVYDYLTTSDGQELYFQGVERLEFSDGEVVSLQTRPDDPAFVDQWDIATGDVGDAWRFTRGSEEVLIVSLDTGVPVSNGNVTTSDFDQSRTDYLLPNTTSNSDGDHGHRATSVIVAEPNNGHGLAGINWESPTLVIDVYGSTHSSISNATVLTDAIQGALDHLENSPARRIVFQGGIQGEYWLSRLDQSLISSNLESTLYSVAAGNGSLDLNDTTTNRVLSAGVARLAGTYPNVLAIGALRPTLERVDGIQNAVTLPLASYSNFGDDLTFAAPSHTRSIGPTGNVSTFSGTSNSNPVVAGYSSLVWSIDPDLTAVEVRDILASTAMDLGEAGRDSTFGWGTPDAGSAVRRAWALSENAELANLEVNAFSSGDVDLGHLLISSNEIAENIDTSAGSVEVGLFSTTNTNLSSLNYTLVAGAGDADNASFEVVGDSLQIRQGTTVDFESQSTYSIRVEVSDGTEVHQQELTIAALDDAESASIVIANGDSQRSVLDNVVVEFDGIVTLGENPFELIRRGGDGGVVGTTAMIDNSSGSSVVTLTFDGAFAQASGSLVDGNYQLTIQGDQIQTASGQNFDGDRDGVAGGDFVYGDSETDNFFRLFGDSTGDRHVNLVELLQLRHAWLSEDEDDNYNVAFDSNQDGRVNVLDLLQFRQNWLARSEFV